MFEKTERVKNLYTKDFPTPLMASLQIFQEVLKKNSQITLLTTNRCSQTKKKELSKLFKIGVNLLS